MTKLLIAGGCSNTDSLYSGYTWNGIITWPEIIAQDFGWDLINTGKIGSGNDTIENRVYDEVSNNLDRDTVVCVMWSSPTRVSLWDIDHIQMHADIDQYKNTGKFEKIYGNTFDRDQWEGFIRSIDNYSYTAFIKSNPYLSKPHKDPFHVAIKLSYLMQDTIKRNFEEQTKDEDEWPEGKIDSLIVDHSLRAMKRCKDTCSHTMFRHKLGLSFTESIPWVYPYWKDGLDFLGKSEIVRRHQKVNQYLRDHPIAQEFGFENMEWQSGWCTAKRMRDGYLLDCGHPNQKGHEAIAEEFMETFDA